MTLRDVRAASGKLFGRSTPLVLSRLLSAAITFGLPLALVRLLEPEMFGTYKQFFLVGQTVLLVGQLGLTQSLYYFVPRDRAQAGGYVAQTFASVAFLGAIAGAALLFGAPSLARWLGSPGLAEFRASLALYAAAMLAAAPLEATLVSDGRPARAALAYTATDALRAVALVAAAALLGAPWMFRAAALVACLRVVALWSLVGRRSLPFARPRRARFRAQLAFALPFAGASFLYVAQRYFSQYAVSASFDPATFALFAVASFHLPVVDIVYTPISEVLMVDLARPAAPRLATWHEAIDRLASILFPAACGAWLFGSTVLPLLFTTRYSGAIPLFLLATAEIPLWVLPVDALLRAAGETRFLFAFNGARLVLTAALVAAGIALYGLAGAIAGTVLSEAISRAVLVARSRRFLEAGPRQVIDWRSAGRIALAAALACVPALACKLLGMQGARYLTTGCILYCATYLAMWWLLVRRAASFARPLEEPPTAAAA